MPTRSEYPLSTTRTAMLAAAKPDTEPTERSISPSRSTSTMPRAITPTGAANSVMFTRLRDDRNVTSLA